MTKRKDNKGLNVNKIIKIAQGIPGLKPMKNNLPPTRFVPSMFPSLNRALVIGGSPLGCIWNIHGPYMNGKTTLAVGILSSFINYGHIGVFIDAEHSAEKSWFEGLGADPNKFLFYRPNFLEDTSDLLDMLITNFDESKNNGEIAENIGMAIVVDSINKLTPKGEFERFIKEGAEAMNKGLARFRGLALQTWLDHLTPIIGKRDISLIFIAQERQEKGAKPWEPQFRVKGCEGLMFDSGIQIRVIGRKIIEEYKKKKFVAGYKNTFHIIKNKFGAPNEKGDYFIGNGKGSIPYGFDRAKNAYEEAKEYREGILEIKSPWIHMGGEKYHGEIQFLNALRNNDAMLNELEERLNKEILSKRKQK